jgi:non-ribosomal peptide synthetase component F
MAGRFLYSTELYDPATILRMIGHWTRLLEGVAADPDRPLGQLPLLGAEEQRLLAQDWNETAQELAHASVADWVAARIAAEPDAVVIEQAGERWTYTDLSRRADTIAARLAQAGAGPGTLVGLSLERTPWMVAAMLAVLRTGAAYLPLDPGFPPARLALIAESAAPALVLVEPATADALPAGAAPRRCWCWTAIGRLRATPAPRLVPKPRPMCCTPRDRPASPRASKFPMPRWSISWRGWRAGWR